MLLYYCIFATSLINPIKHEHSCKILYLFDVAVTFIHLLNIVSDGNFYLHFLKKNSSIVLNSYPASGSFYFLLITFANHLDPDQARQHVGPDLILNMHFPQTFFLGNSHMHKPRVLSPLRSLRMNEVDLVPLAWVDGVILCSSCFSSNNAALILGFKNLSI